MFYASDNAGPAHPQVMEALGPQGTLVNVARGSVVDEAAMITALQQGKLGWAGLDVFEAEPHVPQALRDHPRTVLLPHVASGTVETRAAMGNLTVDNLLQHLDNGTLVSPVPECAEVVTEEHIEPVVPHMIPAFERLQIHSFVERCCLQEDNTKNG